jgi:hypothetical protein
VLDGDKKVPTHQWTKAIWMFWAREFNRLFGFPTPTWDEPVSTLLLSDSCITYELQHCAVQGEVAFVPANGRV